MTTTWKEIKLGEIAEVVTDYVANGSFSSLAQNVHYYDKPDFAVLIRLVDYNNGFKGNFVFIDEHAYKFLAKTKLYGGEIIISNVGANVGTVFKCPKLPYKMSLAPNSIMVKFIGNNDFYFHWLRSYYGQQALQSIVTGSAQPKFNKTNFKELCIPVPPLEAQNKIASILNALDDKIELNNQINSNLEQQAQALFKSWFIDFEPFGGKMPNDWEVIKFEKLANFIPGYSYKSSELSKSNCAMVTIKNFNRNGGFKIDGLKEILPSQKLKNEQKAKIFDILVAHTDLTQNAEIIGNAEMILNTGKYSELIFSMDLVKVSPKSNLSAFLILLLLKNKYFKSHCLGYVNGTTVLHLNKSALPEYEIAFPKNTNCLNILNNVVENIYKNIAKNNNENQRLSEIRDSLLPKLMSGEIDVSKVDIEQIINNKDSSL